MDDPMENKAISAVFATMGRPETVLSCLRALAAQEYQVAEVVVALNDPGDGTAELAGAQDWPFKLVLLQMPGNLGNAGGVAGAINRAMDGATDAIWVLDDDSLPRPGALAAMVPALEQPMTVPHPLQIDPESRDLAWPVAVLDTAGKWKIIFHLSELPETGGLDSRPSWTGSLLPRAAITVAGPVCSALFIRGEDEEYPHRVAALGYRYYLVIDAVLDHPGPSRLVSWRVFGKNIFWEPMLVEWKLYYKIRNQVWLQTMRRGNLRGLVTLMANLLMMLCYDVWQPRRWWVFWLAGVDGLRGKLGKRAGMP